MSFLSPILILGGSGRVGQQVINGALSRGHSVTALVRKPDSIPPQPNLTLITGSPTSASDILRALTTISTYNSTSTSTSTSSTTSKPQVTIISTLGQTRTNPSNPWSAPTSPAMYMSQSAQAVTDTLLNLTSSDPTAPLNVEVSKFIVLSMFGAGDSHAHLHWSLRWVMAHSNMRQAIEDHDEIIKIVRANFAGRDDVASEGGKLSIPFVVVRPVMLKFDQEGKLPAVKEYGHGREGMGMFLGCDVRSVSGFVLDGVVDGRLDGTMPVISN